MEFETLKKDNRKKWVIGIIAVVAIASTIFFVSTRANYKTTQRLNLINSTINWSPTDLEIVSIQLKNGENYTDTNEVPTSGYTLSNESYCEVNGNPDFGIPMEYKDGKIYIQVGNKGTKCYLVFEKEERINDIVAHILATNGGETAIKAKGDPDFSKTSCTSGTYNGTSRTCEEDTTGMWAIQDDDGWSYYFRGSPTNNYVKFGTENGSDIYWRIIRINGDGSIRLIYDGTEYHANGTYTTNSIAVASQKFSHKDAKYNITAGIYEYANDNAYVGYMYGTVGSRVYSATHKNTNSSNAKQQLDTWYTTNLNKEGIKEYIDTNAGFCGDRSLSSGTGGYGTKDTYYGAYYRLSSTKSPSLKCTNSDNDLYTVRSSNKGNKALTYPIGLITADEVVIAGGKIGSIVSTYLTYNYAYYLYNGQNYWTMSPNRLYGEAADVYNVTDGGNVRNTYVSNESGLRPVISLRSDNLQNVKVLENGVYEIS